ncbi:hypothetical protein DB41_HE00160 [Neochlamydia sp. TUME1]|uniref:hypothetical protein n=1 Tax=Neochlamydia sp. TUME1 TaxID=1478174 RepID=UPI000582ACFD|nr:hypothetical protein [Neochlamydia sp. TUME1]KIC75800.1 hypothetical protein DB41_HE00160 [Neochlamydia sp. TUME1]
MQQLFWQSRRRKSLKKVMATTTGMSKAIAFPTDVKLYFKSIQVLVKMADSCQVTLRQTYKKLAKKAFYIRARLSPCSSAIQS